MTDFQSDSSDNSNSLSSTLLRRKAFDSLKRFKEKIKPFIEGHRGCNKEEDENTLAAFQKAIEHGCDSIEFDVWLTKDKIPVVIHGSKDGNLKETTNGEGKIETFTFEEISKFFTIANNHKIPTLEEVFTLCKNKIFMNIEIKDKNFTLECLEKVIELINCHGIKEQVALSTFEQHSWEHLKKICDCHSIESGYLYDNHDNRTIEIQYDITKQNATMNVWYGDITAEFVDKAHQNNIAVHCWFCLNDKEDEDTIMHLIKCEVDVICCNNPRNVIELRDKFFKMDL
jgi:glycerophosphoryl diester phosphodiesterase